MVVRAKFFDSQWGDLLTSFDGVTITYDAIGNPLSYYNGTSYTFTWEGRRLVGAVSGSNTMSFEYNDEGIRTSKTVNGVETVYYVNGGQIVAEKTGTRTIVYIYDASGTPIGMMYRTTSYAENIWDVFWYEKNLQGDIVAVYNSAGTKVATYTYTDAWGNHSVSYSNGGASTGVIYNPFRYRSYYYDSDLGMYYLQSRYYDAKICRFISADAYVSTGQGIIGFNMFAYCGNNPVMGYDPTGHWDWGGVIIGTVLVTIAGIAAYFGSMSTETGALITGAVMATGVSMIAAAATYSQMVMDISGTSPLLNNLKHGYFKGGATLLIDFDNDEACFYIHGGVGYAESWGITGDISYGTGLVWNYDSPDDFSKTFLDVYAGGIVGLEYGVSPDKPITSATQSLSVTFSRARLNACSIGGGVDYYSYPIILFEWRK